MHTMTDTSIPTLPLVDQIFTLAIPQFDAGYAEGSISRDLTLGQTGEILGYAAELVKLLRERKPITQVLAQLDQAMSEAHVVPAAPDVRQWVANASNTPRDQWEFIEGRDTGVGTDYWMRNTVTDVVAYAGVVQGDVISLSIEADDPQVDTDDAAACAALLPGIQGSVRQWQNAVAGNADHFPTSQNLTSGMPPVCSL